MAVLRVAQSDWIVEGRTLKKQVGYLGLLEDGAELILQLHIDVSPNEVFGGLHTHVCMIIYPNFLTDHSTVIPVQLALEDALVDSPIVTARCGPCADGSAIIQPLERAGADAFMASISKCKTMRLALFNDKGIFLKLPIPNDDQYVHAARQFFSQAQTESASQETLFESLVRVEDEPQKSGIISKLAGKIFG